MINFTDYSPGDTRKLVAEFLNQLLQCHLILYFSLRSALLGEAADRGSIFREMISLGRELLTLPFSPGILRTYYSLSRDIRGGVQIGIVVTCKEA